MKQYKVTVWYKLIIPPANSSKSPILETFKYYQGIRKLERTEMETLFEDEGNWFVADPFRYRVLDNLIHLVSLEEYQNVKDSDRMS